MDHHIEDQEEKMQILFESDKEDLKENGINVERETELFIIEDVPSPIAIETTDFDCRSDKTSSPDPDKSHTSQATSEDLTLSPLTNDCVPPPIEDHVFPLVEELSSTICSTLKKQELKSPSDQVAEDFLTYSDKRGENSECCFDYNSRGSNLDLPSSNSDSNNDVLELYSGTKTDDNKSFQTDHKEDSESSCEIKPITVEVTSNLPPITGEVTSNLPPITGEVTKSIPPITGEVTESIPPITGEVTKNIPPITEDDTATIPPITDIDVASNLHPITAEVMANNLPVTDGVRFSLGNNTESAEEQNISKELTDNQFSENNDVVICTEDPVEDGVVAVVAEESNGKTTEEKFTFDSGQFGDSPGSTDVSLPPGLQGSSDPPLTQSSIATCNYQEGMKALQTELVQTHNLVKQLQAVIIRERVTHSHHLAALKMRLQQKDEECRKNEARCDEQLGEVIAHLLLLEGQLKKEHLQVRRKMADNENIIRKQEQDIESLTETNQRLLEAVHDAYGRKNKNGVILLDNSGDDNNGSSESLESPTSKSPPSLKLPHKGKWGSMKDKMTRKHRSSLDLSDTEFDVNRGLLVGRQYGSQESLLMIGRKSKEAREGRDKKCRSIAGYPDSSLVGLMEVPDESENRIENFSHSKVFDGNRNQCRNEQTWNTLQITLNEMDQSSAGLLSAISMPILSQSDKNSNSPLTKERPKSISSIEHISSHDNAGTQNISPQMESYPPPPKSPGATSNSSFSDSSNPFKNLKTILKRKGSKIKGKKRSVTMADAPSQDYQAAVKKHFEKYDMS